MACFVEAWSGRRGKARHGLVLSGQLWYGELRHVAAGVASRGMEGRFRIGQLRSGMAGRVSSALERRAMDGESCLVTAWQARIG